VKFVVGNVADFIIAPQMCDKTDQPASYHNVFPQLKHHGVCRLHHAAAFGLVLNLMSDAFFNLEVKGLVNFLYDKFLSKL
jgi:hypothetical protein